VAGFSRIAPGRIEGASGGAVNCKTLEQDAFYVEKLLECCEQKRPPQQLCSRGAFFIRKLIGSVVQSTFGCTNEFEKRRPKD